MEFDFAAWWGKWGMNLIHVGVILILGIIAGVVVRKLTDRMVAKAESLEDRRSAQRHKTLSVFLKSVAKVVILALVGVLILGEFGVEIGPLIAAAGIAGIAIGFGAQTLVQDFLGGTFLLTEGYVRVGDVLEVNGKAGLVEDISLRLLVMRDFAGNVHVIPNGEIRTITNMTYRFSRALIEVGVAYREDNDKVVRIMEEVGNEIAEEMKDVIEAGPEIFGIDSFGDSAINWRVRFQTKPIEQWNVARAYRRRLKRRFDEEGIEIPFPHRTVYMGENHDGTAPFLHTKMYRANGQEPEGHRDVDDAGDPVKRAGDVVSTEASGD
ncbi:mechanosensitive ion channel family protein [bacterium]|nr:mechanosensitive ion channel family protein [bacterium]